MNILLLPNISSLPSVFGIPVSILVFNSLNNCLSSNDIGNTMNNNDKQMNLKHNKKKTPFIENSYINNEQLKSQNNTINNINNFNSCNYIYLLNNGDKFIKINRQFKI